MKGGGKMKKASIVMLLVLSSVVLICGSAYAVSGVCSNCHTMHYSQNGTILSDWGAAGPYNYLLLDSCIGCHTGPTTTPYNTHGAPIVMTNNGQPGGGPHLQGGGYTNAGGNFYWVASVTNGGMGNDRMGHNVSGLSDEDQFIGQNGPGYTPPGWQTSGTPDALNDGSINGAGSSWSSQLTCAGLYGCHGRHGSSDITADQGILGSHHSNTDGTQTVADGPLTVGGSYRFLGGISGRENSLWNWYESPSVHNEYKGVDGNSGFTNKTTISYSCAECHGKFHSETGTGASPWLRHPTDFSLPNDSAKEYTNYGVSGYSVEAPVARTDMTIASSSSVTPGTGDAIVMCLSCHRAHGSPESDILRWQYSTQVAGSGDIETGCFVCHRHKNAH
jgi:hypothetical protein